MADLPDNLRAADAAGFSLVEVLVTLSIIALASALIVATAIPANPLRAEREKLVRTLTDLDARVRITGQPAGLRIDPRGYSVVTWSGETWSEVSSSRHDLTGKVVIEAVDGLRPMPASRGGAPAAPQIVFDPLGHSTLKLVSLVSGAESAEVDARTVLKRTGS